MNLPPIQAALFDAAGTLIQLRDPVGVEYARVARRHGIFFEPEAADIAFRTAWKSMPPPGAMEQDPSAPHQHSEKAWWRDLVLKVLEDVAPASCDDFDAYFEDLFAEYAKPELWRPYPEAAATLEQLASRKIRLFVLSNFDARLLPVLDGHDLRRYFEQIFYSGAIGHSKPSHLAFQYAVQRIGSPAAGCLHIGDDPIADWQGARTAGLQHFELDRRQIDLSKVLERPNLPDFSD